MSHSLYDWSVCVCSQLLPPTWHLLHLHLDLHWSLLELLHLLGHKMQGRLRPRGRPTPSTGLHSLGSGSLPPFLKCVCVCVGQVVYVQQDLTGENVTDVSLLEQQLTNLLCDLTSLAISKYCKVTDL